VRHVHEEYDECFICVTDRKDISGLDAMDAKWVYQCAADDPGQHFEMPGAPK